MTCKLCGKTEGLKQCTQCKEVKYCSKECQVKDWKEHKFECSIMYSINCAKKSPIKQIEIFQNDIKKNKKKINGVKKLTELQMEFQKTAIKHSNTLMDRITCNIEHSKIIKLYKECSKNIKDGYFLFFFGDIDALINHCNNYFGAICYYFSNKENLMILKENFKMVGYIIFSKYNNIKNYNEKTHFLIKVAVEIPFGEDEHCFNTYYIPFDEK